jgi:hypothetical protein
MAGFDNQSGQITKFVKRKKYEDLSPEELVEMDALADMLAQNPSLKKLKKFYHSSRTLQIESAVKDPYSFVFKK